MLTVFNRKEVYTTQNMKKQAEIRDSLASAGIHYTYKVRTRGGNYGRVRTPFIGSGDRGECIYIFYVHKKDYEWACGLLRRY